LRQNVVTDYLRQRRIDDANIQGIGMKLRERLAAAGIVTAADVDRQRIRSIEGIGDAKARELEDWATLHRWQAEALAPTALPALVRGSILAKFQALRDSLAASRESAERKCFARREKITSDSALRQAAVDRQSTLIDEQHDREYSAACQQFERDRQRLLSEFNHLWPAASAEKEVYRANRRKLETALLSARGDLLRVQKQIAQLAALTFARYFRRMAGMD
jgi:DNA-binding helix-hairpin-helix protein with protein kinase domain